MGTQQEGRPGGPTAVVGALRTVAVIEILVGTALTLLTLLDSAPRSGVLATGLVLLGTGHLCYCTALLLDRIDAGRQ